MKIVLVNPPHTAIGSRIPREQLPPLGLLSIGGPLIDAGFDVSLVDSELGPLSLRDITSRVHCLLPDIVMIGHSGSSSVHDTVVELCGLLKENMPELTIVYGGVHPTYLWDEILSACHAIDFIVRGEGERTALLLAEALAQGRDPAQVDGIAYRRHGEVNATPPAEMIRDLDEYRVGWELIDHAHYSYWGGSARWSCNLRAVARTSAITAGSAAIGRNGGTGIPLNWPGKSRACIANMALN